MENWPGPQLPSMTRFCCKLMNTGIVKHYDIDSYQTITQMLLRIKPLIKEYFGFSNYKLKCEKNGCILSNSIDKIHKKFSSCNFVILTIIPDYMYSRPECIFYNSRDKSDRISYLIKQDAIKKLQHFYRSIFKKECPCCYEIFNNNVKYYNCSHSICSICFNDWNARRPTCPLCRQPVKQEYACVRTQDSNQTRDINIIQNNNRIQNTNDSESLGYIWNILRAMPSNMPYTNTIETTTESNSEIISSSRRANGRVVYASRAAVGAPGRLRTDIPTLYDEENTHLNMPYTNTTGSESNYNINDRRRRRFAITEAPTLYNNGQRIELADDDSDEENMSPDNTPFSHIN
jgi:hypothetical protein